MTTDLNGFQTMVLEKVAHRYRQRGKLSGRMKVGTTLGNEKLQVLYKFFGPSAIWENRKGEVHILFDHAVQDAPESHWVDKIGSYLGCKLHPKPAEDFTHTTHALLSRLKLGFPELETLTDHLSAAPESLTRLLKKNPEQVVTACCFQTAETLRFLLRNKTPITLSELGARFFKDSKVLRQGATLQLLLDWLAFYAPNLEDRENEDQLLVSHNVYHDRLMVNAVLYGPVLYEKNGKTFDWIYQLYCQGEAATISWANLQGIEQIHWRVPGKKRPKLICCENEAPFSQLIREQRSGCFLFTSGFPGSAVRKLYELLASQAASCHHWGDTDPNGLYIASLLHAIHPLTLFRCDLDTLQKHDKLLLPLTNEQHKRVQTMLQGEPRFPFQRELEYTLKNGWLEQESWQRKV